MIALTLDGFVFLVAGIILVLIVIDFCAELLHRRQLRKDEERQRILRRWRDAE